MLMPSGCYCLFLPTRLRPRQHVGAVLEDASSRQPCDMPAVDVCPFLTPWHGRPSRAEVRQGSGSRVTAWGRWLPQLPRPSHFQAVSPGLHSTNWVFPPLGCSGPSTDRDLGTSPHSSQWGIWGWSGQAGMRGQRADKGAKEEALSQASLFSSPTGPGHGPVSGRSPGTGALTPEVPPSPGTTGRFNQGGRGPKGGERNPGRQEWWRAHKGHTDN